MEMSKAKAENRPLPKRFYAAAHYAAHADGFAILLDGKNIRTPQQKLLHTTAEALAQQITAEWAAQGEFIDTDTMPLTRLLNIALDRIIIDRDALLKDIAGYCETDLLFYRAPPSTVIPAKAGIHLEQQKQMDSSFRWNDGLAELQVQHFDPVLARMQKEYGISFVLTDGLIPVAQPAATLQKLSEIFAAASDHALAALSLMVPILGSALLVLAVWKKFLSIDEALVAARLDESVQEAQWGAAPEATEKWDAKCRDAKAAEFFLFHH